MIWRRKNRSAVVRVLCVLLLLLPAPFRCGEGTTAVAGEAAAAGGSEQQQQLQTGFRLLEQDDFDGARAAFDRALSGNPRSAAARTGLGAVLARQGKLDEAKRLLLEALDHNPDPARTFYELGRVYEQQGDFRRAAASYREGLEKHRPGRK